MAADATNSNLERYRRVVVLRDGTTLPLRAIRPEDIDRLIAFFNRLSQDAVYFRFHHTMAQLTREEAQRLCNLDYDSALALVATTGEGKEERIVAVGRYFRLPGQDTAEAAFTVEDTYQGKGLGTHILKELAKIARGKGIRLFEAEVLSENEEMLQVFRDSGFTVSQQREGDAYRVLLDISP